MEKCSLSASQECCCVEKDRAMDFRQQHSKYSPDVTHTCFNPLLHYHLVTTGNFQMSHDFQISATVFKELFFFLNSRKRHVGAKPFILFVSFTAVS